MDGQYTRTFRFEQIFQWKIIINLLQLLLLLWSHKERWRVIKIDDVFSNKKVSQWKTHCHEPPSKSSLTGTHSSHHSGHLPQQPWSLLSWVSLEVRWKTQWVLLRGALQCKGRLSKHQGTTASSTLFTAPGKCLDRCRTRRQLNSTTKGAQEDLLREATGSVG